MTIKKSIVTNYTATGLVAVLVLSMGLAAAQTPTTAAAGRLTLSLQPGLDADGDVKATYIMKAELSGPDGLFTRNATIIDSKAQFDLSGVVPGDYFIRVNDLNDDLVPTRIDDPGKTINQFVGQKLRVSVVGSLSNATYRIKTFSKGQGEHPVVGYPDGTNLSPEWYAYVILSLQTSPQKLEIRVLGSTRVNPTGGEINSFTPGTATHPSTLTAINPPYSTWMVMTGESIHHGDDYNGTDSKCNTCHANMDAKPAKFSEITSINGWCYRCHYGKGGVDNGFIDTTSLPATPTVTITAPVTATVKPTETPKAPALEALLAISALLAAILAGKRNKQ